MLLIFFLIGNQSNINHDEKKRRKNIHGVHDGEHKPKQQTKSKKNNSSDNSKRRKKLNELIFWNGKRELFYQL